MAATPFMSLTIPTPTVTAAPQWGSQLVAAFSTIDGHTHAPGFGALVPTAGLKLDADLAFNLTAALGLNAIGLRSTRFLSQSTVAGATDVGCIYNAGGNLFWNNGSGQAVQITAGATLSATSLGGISGLPSGTATASFGSATFTWRAATNVAATMDGGPVVIRDTGASALGITLASPVGLAGAYGLTFPAALPASTKLLTVASTGTISVADVDNSTLQNVSGTLSVKPAGIGSSQVGTLARSNLPSVGQQISSSCGTFTATPSATLTDVTNLTVSITTTGRPVLLLMQPDGTTTPPASWWGPTSSTGQVRLWLLRGASVLAGWESGNSNGAATPESASSQVYLDAVGAGTYTYKIQTSGTFGTPVQVTQFKLVAWEL